MNTHTKKKVRKGDPLDKVVGGFSKRFKHLLQGHSTGESIRFFAGILLGSLALYLIGAYVQYFIKGGVDQSVIVNQAAELTTSEQVQNPTGINGAYVMHLLVNDWVGIPAILVVVFLGMVGLRLLSIIRTPMLSLFTTFTLFTFWGSLFFTLVMRPFHSSLFFYPGGQLGEIAYQYLTGKIGIMGLLLLLFASMAILLFVTFPSVKKAYIRWAQGRRARLRDHAAREEEEKRATPEEAAIKDPKKPSFWQRLGQKQRVASTPTEEREDTDSSLSVPTTDISVVAGTGGSALTPTAPVDDADEGDIETAIQPLENDPIVMTATETEIPSASGIELEVIDARAEDEEGGELSRESLAACLVAEHGEYDPKLDLGQYVMPSIELLDQRNVEAVSIDNEEIQRNQASITETLRSFGVEITKITATVGPTITLYEVVPESGVKIARIRNLEDDIALSLSALGIRIIAPMPGKGTVGLEVPNKRPQIVSMRSVISSRKFMEAPYELPVVLGRTITNDIFTFDLAKVPHLLVAGATGQGKSVGLNAVITSLLYRKHPAELKFVMIDPKMVEFSIYSAIEKHYMAKLPEEKECIITDTKRVVTTLNSLCQEMDDRYELLKKAKVRNIMEYNDLFKSRRLNPYNGHKYLPYIVVIIDEYGDLIMTAGKEIELPIARLAQKARAVGIHAIIATQRPTASIITGTIKANFPGRISFRVFSQVDSRTILDATGANRLVGKGDLLYSQGNDFVRVQCAFVDTPEVNRIVDFISAQKGYPHAYELPEVSAGEVSSAMDFTGAVDLNERDALFESVARMLVMEQQGSVSFIQRKFSIGYNRAGRMMDQLEAAGIVGPADGQKQREVLVKSEEHLDQILSEMPQ